MPNALLTHYNAENNLVIIIGLTDGIIRQKRDINIEIPLNKKEKNFYEEVSAHFLKKEEATFFKIQNNLNPMSL